MTVFQNIGADVCGFRDSWRPSVDSDGRHLDVFVPLPFDRCFWLYYSRCPK